MFRKLLIPVDGSPMADQILLQVRRLLLREDAELTLLRVLPHKPGPKHLEAWEVERDRALQHLDGLKTVWTREGAQVKTEMRLGHPAEEILRFSGEHSPSLIAMSTHGRTGMDRWVRGSVAERVLERAYQPLLVANPRGLQAGNGEAGPHIRRLLVPLDGSQASMLILPMVIEIARLFGSEVTLFHCALLLPTAAHPENAGEYAADEALVALEPWRKKFETIGVPVRLAGATGYPPAEILAAAERENADLVAMTTHGRTGLNRFLFGSVAEKVLRICRVPLLVLRTGGSPRSDFRSP